ncbi:3-keto-5-aminohexanoate cleavage protein [Crossiella sp. CA198]|uniref:3-keto-5-aminohexanoate cleavage protein n=1 Tax=Crossiella sp. CA198 TaxID=3455607 RepID=UPI003F8D64E8
MLPLLQCCPNGNRPAEAHPAVPITPWQLASTVAEVAELGVTSVHLHPRDAVGLETLAGPELATVVATVRAAAPGVEIGVSTGAWITPDPVRRAQLVAGWSGLAAGRPDVASVNVHEPGWLEVCVVLHRAGIGIELGVFTIPAAARLRAAGGPPPGTVRVLAEVQETHPDRARPAATALLEALDFLPDDLPILLHGEEAGAWPVLAEAARLGLPRRIGLEDTLVLPDGEPAADNSELIRAAQEF